MVRFFTSNLAVSTSSGLATCLSGRIYFGGSLKSSANGRNTQLNPGGVWNPSFSSTFSLYGMRAQNLMMDVSLGINLTMAILSFLIIDSIKASMH
jgi:hypothetical protein